MSSEHFESNKTEQYPEVDELSKVTTWEELFAYLDTKITERRSDEMIYLRGALSQIRAGKPMSSFSKKIFGPIRQIKQKVAELLAKDAVKKQV